MSPPGNPSPADQSPAPGPFHGLSDFPCYFSSLSGGATVYFRRDPRESKHTPISLPGQDPLKQACAEEAHSKYLVSERMAAPHTTHCVRTYIWGLQLQGTPQGSESSTGPPPTGRPLPTRCAGLSGADSASPPPPPATTCRKTLSLPSPPHRCPPSPTFIPHIATPPGPKLPPVSPCPQSHLTR